MELSTTEYTKLSAIYDAIMSGNRPRRAVYKLVETVENFQICIKHFDMDTSHFKEDKT